MASLASLGGLGTSLYNTLWDSVWSQQATVFMLAVMQRWVHEDVEVHVTVPASSPLRSAHQPIKICTSTAVLASV